MPCSREVVLLLLALWGSVAAASTCELREQSRCNFVCDCWDCSDERDCGYHRDSPVWGVSFSCDFEHDDCGWRDISTSGYRWVRDRRTMWSSRSHGDHTLGNRWGWFMAAEGPRGKSPTSADFQSPVLRDAAATCEIHLHYHMWSADASSVNGSLSVQLTDSTQSYTVWESSRGSATAWRRAVIYTGRISGDFQVIVTSSRNALSWFDMAIDDIEFRNCGLSGPQVGCEIGQHHCARGSCVEEGARCDLTDDCGDASDEADCGEYTSCSFESDSCKWTSTWERVNGFSSKPGRDHTANKKSGYFLRALQNNTTPSSLTSPVLLRDSTKECFLVLYYLLDGSSSSSLTISVSQNNVTETVLERVGERGPVWLREKVPLKSYDGMFQITIEGSSGGEVGTVAIDDVILSPGCLVQGNSSKAVEASPGVDKTVTSAIENCIHVSAVYDFAKDSDGWRDVSIGDLKWERYEEGNRTLLAVVKAEGNLKTRADIRSPLLCAVGPQCNMTMTYRLNSGPAGFLTLFVWDPQLGTHAHLWHRQGERSNASSATFPLGERKQPFQLMLFGSVDPQPGGDWRAEVEQIEFLNCTSETPSEAEVTCNFETGLCGWYQDLTDDIDWTLGSLSDHTTGQGHYMYVEGESRRDRGHTARLISYPQSSDLDKNCLSFHHRQHGPDTGTLNLFSKYDGGEEVLIWTRSGTHGNRWHRDAVTLTNKKYQLIFEAVRDGSVGHIAIDDITITRGSCPTPTHCSFEAGTCGYTSDGQYKWKLHQMGRTEPHIGPYFDHTLQSFAGHYMVIDTSSTSLPRKKTATMTSSEYSALPEESCLSFWYQLGGAQPGSLTVYVEENTGKKKAKRQLLSVSGTHQESWHHTSVALQSNNPWALLFEAVGGGGDHSYIAVDDIHISHHRCHEAVSCDFELGFCSWTNVRIPLMDTYDWDWTYGTALHRPSAAPEKDQSLGTSEGHYAFVDTGAMHAEGTSAWLISEPLQSTTASCFSFWYRTDSQDHPHLGELIVYLTSEKGLLPVWVLHGYHSTDWQEQQLQLNSTVEFQIVFEASKGSRPHSAVVSVDNVKYTPDLLCNAEPKKPAKKSNSGTIWAAVISVIIFLLFCLLLLMVYRRWRRQRDDSPALPDQMDNDGGFDNVVYDQDDDAVSNNSDR
ncbi:apical endosomal glycoprotein [Hyperolius riggenbachi]|uniref:apical endosomal glycoprotein n=1 Tax=Hyperolius riggenbachi TaxID=752182 RepID=UPI0035A3B5C1